MFIGGISNRRRKPYNEANNMEIRALSIGRGAGWISEGFALFGRNPLIWIVLTLAYLAVTIVLNLIPFLWAVALTLLLPVLAAGFMAGCQDLAEGGELRVEHLFEGFRRDTQPLLMVGLLSFAGMIAVSVIAGVIVLSLGGALLGLGILTDGAPESGELFGTLMAAGGMMAILLLLLVFSIMILPLAMATWFAPALVWFDKLPAFEAMKQSFIGCWRNMLPLSLYGLLLIPLSLLALLPFGLGILVLIPVFFASIYVSYRDIYSGADT
jgi:uncharacterized membrane protein